MRILQVGDLHFADNSPTGRIDNYRETCLAKLRQCANISNEYNPDMVLLMGDIFHIKRPSAVSHYLVNEMNAIFDTFNVEPYFILGNHDIPTEGASFSWYPVASLHINPLLTPFSLMGAYFIPIFGTSAALLLDNLSMALRHKPQGEISVVCSHLSFFDAPAMYDTYPTRLFKGLANIVLNGHIHVRTVYVDKFDGSNFLFSNPGSLMRVSRSAADRAHHPKVALIDTEKFSVDLIPIDHVVADDIFSFDELIEDKVREEVRDKFISALEDITFSGTGTEAIISRIKEVDIDEEVKSTAIKIIQEL